MAKPLLPQWAQVPTPVIGMVHLLALPGAPRFGGDPGQIERAMLRDAEALIEGGVHGLMLENFGDVPFYPGRVPAAVVSHITVMALKLRQRWPDLPLGINLLRNDGRGALAIAHAVGAQFIRVNVLCGARVTDQGIIRGIAHQLLRDRAAWQADVRIFADVNVKHSAPLGDRPSHQEVDDVIHRGLADAVIVTGSGTGQTVDHAELSATNGAAGDTPVIMGSGVTADSAASYAGIADAFIIGTAFKHDGVSSAPVDRQRVQTFMRRLSQ